MFCDHLRRNLPTCIIFQSSGFSTEPCGRSPWLSRTGSNLLPALFGNCLEDIWVYRKKIHHQSKGSAWYFSTLRSSNCSCTGFIRASDRSCLKHSILLHWMPVWGFCRSPYRHVLFVWIDPIYFPLSRSSGLMASRLMVSQLTTPPIVQ